MSSVMSENDLVCGTGRGKRIWPVTGSFNIGAKICQRDLEFDYEIYIREGVIWVKKKDK